MPWRHTGGQSPPAPRFLRLNTQPTKARSQTGSSGFCALCFGQSDLPYRRWTRVPCLRLRKQVPEREKTCPRKRGHGTRHARFRYVLCLEYRLQAGRDSPTAFGIQGADERGAGCVGRPFDPPEGGTPNEPCSIGVQRHFLGQTAKWDRPCPCQVGFLNAIHRAGSPDPGTTVPGFREELFLGSSGFSVLPDPGTPEAGVRGRFSAHVIASEARQSSLSPIA